MTAEETKDGRLNGTSQAEPVVSALRASVTDADILTGDDGMSVFWPDGRNGGFTARHLRAIADEMDRRDAPLVRSMNRYLRAQRICDSDRVLSVFAAPEWSELGDDGKEWILAIIDEVDAQGMETRQGGNEVPSRSDDSPVACDAPIPHLGEQS